MIRKTYKYRLYPSKAQGAHLNETLALCCELYNAGLQERRDAWRINRKSIICYEQILQLPEIKESRPELHNIYSQVLQDVLKRLDKAFDAFFRRVKAGGKAGFPRFRSRSRYDSFTYTQSGFSLKDGKLQLSKIGKVKIKLHRPAEGKIKTLTITRSATGKWYACFSVECTPEPLPENSNNVGVDVGLSHFATLSNGEQVSNPRFFRTDEKALARAQRKLSVEKKGTAERANRRKVVARIHERIANRRRNFAHQLSHALVSVYGLIAFEKLNVKGMVKNHHLAKSIGDAAWNQLVQFTAYKAEYAGRRVVLVDPRNTSKRCSSCGELVEKSLSERIHDCGCGLLLDRDHNAAINILSLGLQTLEIATQRSPAL